MYSFFLEYIDSTDKVLDFASSFIFFTLENLNTHPPLKTLNKNYVYLYYNSDMFVFLSLCAKNFHN